MNLDFLKKLYDYQSDAVEATDNNDRGIVCMPTGTGKTFCQAAIIAKDIVLNDGKFGVYVINAPRIMLSYQLLKEVYSFLTYAGVDARYMSVHSGGSIDIEDLEEIRMDANMADGTNISYAEIESGTSPILIKEFMLKAQEQNLPLIIFSTYHSAERINDAIPDIKIRLVMNDEAQYLVQEQFYDIIHILNYERCYFFTATKVNTPSKNGRGMNNTNSYGETIYEMLPREAIDLGKMLRPRMHFVLSKSGKSYTEDDVENNLGKIVEEVFAQHRYAIGAYTKPKLLIASRGVESMRKFLESDECNRFIRSGVSIYSVSSELGSVINGESFSRSAFLEQLKKDGDDPTKEMIVIHYDILTEGIDTSGLSGVLTLRSLRKTKFMQTYGRVARLNPYDRERITSGKLDPSDLSNFEKPYGWVIIPDITDGDSDLNENVRTTIEELRRYDFNPSEDIIVSDPNNGLPIIEGPDALLELKRNGRSTGVIIEQIEADYEDERLASLSQEEWFYENFPDGANE